MFCFLSPAQKRIAFGLTAVSLCCRSGRWTFGPRIDPLCPLSLALLRTSTVRPFSLIETLALAQTDIQFMFIFFSGTGEGALACLAENITLGGCQASIIQQTIGSRFLGALLAKGNQALVPTTSIYTTYDEIIQPENNPVTSQLNGAANVRVQNYCGPGYVIGHTQIPYASYPYYLAVNALTNQAPANPAAVPSTLCAWAQSGALLTQFQNGIGLLAEDLTAV